VGPGEGDLEGASRLEQAAHVGEVREVAEVVAGRRRRGLLWDELGTEPRPMPADAATPQQVGGLCQRGCADDLDARDEARLGEGARRHDHATGSATREGRDHRQDPRYRADLPAQAQLAEERPRPARPDLLRTDQDRDGDPEVQGRAGLRHVRGGEIDRDAARGMDEPAVPQGAAHALPGLAEGDVGEADDREAGESGRNVGLDPDGAAVEADERGGEDACEHGSHGSDRRSPADYPPLMRPP